jgi:putative ABC transport system permease protein
MALGAQPGMVLRMIMREGSITLFSGILLGLLLAAATGKILSGMLYEVGALDPVAFTFAPLVLAIAALFATWLPPAAPPASVRWRRYGPSKAALSI